MGKFILNGKIYTGNSADGFPPLIYSDDEREVGVWRDGKPLYQKVINVGSLPQIANTAKNVEHNISNIDTVCLLRGAAKNSSGTILPLPYIAPDNLGYGIQLSATSTYIVLRTGTDRSAFSGYAIIQYTKTTDTAGSGYWATNGDRAIHYSTMEQVIGTWIDGKPLYERVMSVIITTAATSGVPYDFSTDVLDHPKIASIKGIFSDAMGISGNFSGKGQTSQSNFYIDMGTSSATYGKLGGYTTRNDFVGHTFYAVVQYTKTTD